MALRAKYDGFRCVASRDGDKVEAAALLAIGAMRRRLERKMFGERIGQEDAAQRALRGAERVRHTRTTLHRAISTQTRQPGG